MSAKLFDDIFELSAARQKERSNRPDCLKKPKCRES